MDNNANLPKSPSERDRQRQAVEQVVQQKQQAYRQQALGSLYTLRDLAQQIDLSNPHLSRLMVNSAYAIKRGTDVLTDMTRDELWTQLGLYDDEVHEEEDLASAPIIIDAQPHVSPTQDAIGHLPTGQTENHQEENHG